MLRFPRTFRPVLLYLFGVFTSDIKQQFPDFLLWGPEFWRWNCEQGFHIGFFKPISWLWRFKLICFEWYIFIKFLIIFYASCNALEKDPHESMCRLGTVKLFFNRLITVFVRTQSYKSHFSMLQKITGSIVRIVLN